jgi:hypothetical protein
MFLERLRAVGSVSSVTRKPPTRIRIATSYIKYLVRTVQDSCSWLYLDIYESQLQLEDFPFRPKVFNKKRSLSAHGGVF